MKDRVEALNLKFRESSAETVLTYFTDEFRGQIAFATSLGMEDQVIIRMLSVIPNDVHCFTLDTGRLFPETYDLLDITRKKYRVGIRLYFPDAGKVERMVQDKGINLFYDSVENRRLCCQIRKIESLQRALQGKKIWINGLRRAQSVTRADLELVEWDEAYQIIKLNPLILWTDQDVSHYIETHKIPYNPLHDKGFTSIGCQPCTRAIVPGEDIRSGRWWWESPLHRECGLHTHDKNDEE